MASTLSSFDSQHEDMIHDAQYDYYGKRLATCSSDRTIRIFEAGENPVLLAELKGHEGPVWQVAWGHPKFGGLLASCSYDRKIFVWKETAPNTWTKIYEYDKHESSVNSISWASHEFGPCLATASSDGSIVILTYRGDNSWDAQRVTQAHAIGVNAVSWGPAVSPSSLVTSTAPTVAPIKRFASGGCDNLVKIWRFSENENVPKVEETLEGVHTDWVRDVAWSPNIGLPTSTIASCSQDGTVVIWTHDNTNWSKKILPKFPDVVWRVSWSITGNILAVASADNKITLWKEGPDNEWKCISALTEEGEQHLTPSN